MAKFKGLNARLHLLTAREIHAAREGDANDGGGLVLRVGATTASWVLRYTGPTGRRREMGLGPARRSTLAQAGETLVAARQAAQQARDLLRQDIDPLDARQEQQEQVRATEDAGRRQPDDAEDRQRWTLARCARDYHERVIEPSRTPKHAAQWISSLENHMPPRLWHAPVETVTAPAVLAALVAMRPHERARNIKGSTLPETQRRVRQRLEAVLEDAAFHGRATGNAAAAVRRKLRESQPARRVKGAFRALAYGEAPNLVQRLRAMPGTAAWCLEFALFTVARTSEVKTAESSAPAKKAPATKARATRNAVA